MGKYMSITTAGLGVSVVSLLLFAGCKDSDGEQPTIPETVGTETLNPPDSSGITIPTVDPPTRPSSSVDTFTCGMEGVDCAPTPTTTDDSPPPSSDTPSPSPAETAEPPG